MNPRKVNRQPPSLLAEIDERECGIPQNITSDSCKNPDRRSRGIRPKYTFALLTALMLFISGLIIHALPAPYRTNPSPVTAPFELEASMPVTKTALAPFATTTAPLPDTSSRAVIVNEPPSVAAAPAEMPTHTISKNVTKAPASPVKIIPQPALRTHPAPAKPQPTSDIDVLIAMIRYSEDEKSVRQIDLQQRIDQCPAANTVKGVQCRQKICAELPAATSLCPAAH